jgi:16S rRNA C967 or C1407 C5-methylase (RsmB/RsmF family)
MGGNKCGRRSRKSTASRNGNSSREGNDNGVGAKSKTFSTGANKRMKAPGAMEDWDSGQNYVERVTREGNFAMECYYAIQGMHNSKWVPSAASSNSSIGQLVPCDTNDDREQERLRWRENIGEILPSSFRIAADIPPVVQHRVASEIQTLLSETSDRIKNPIQESVDDTMQGESDGNEGASIPATSAVEPDDDDGQSLDLDKMVTPLHFLPYAYQMTLDRRVIRKHPELKFVHEWFKQQTSSGFVTRQETVSMIPPVLLNVSPSDTVLDMCAAPGSKTGQLLEGLGPQGRLVANDSSESRAYMLVHQLRRIMHHNPVAIVTNCDAQYFPAVQNTTSDVASSSTSTSPTTHLQFDKILADVPCSGDGTTRKNINVWKTWTNSGAMSLHRLQLDIAWRGCAYLLKTGGYLCYSTCSLNPVEDEAVVAQLLLRSKGQLELIPVRLDNNQDVVDRFFASPGNENIEIPELKGFRTRCGISSWKILCEKQSRKQMKSASRKNRPMMKKKRQEHQHEAKGDELSNQEEVINLELNGTNDEVDAVQDDCKEADVVRFAPTDWDDVSLLKLASDCANLVHYQSPAEVPDGLKCRIPETVFSPSVSMSAADVANLHLDRCIRCLPHDNNTGGFFVALLRKKGHISTRDERIAKHQSSFSPDDNMNVTDPQPTPAGTAQESGDSSVADGDAQGEASAEKSPDIKRPKIEPAPAEDAGPIEKPRISGRRYPRGKGAELGREDFVPVDSAVMDEIIQYYGLSNDFPRELYMTRAGGDSKQIYYIARPIKDLIDLGLQRRVTVINTGLKGFARNNQECSCKYR